MDEWKFGVGSAIQCRSPKSDWKVLRSLGFLFILFTFWFLQEANWANVNTKFLISSTNIHRCNVYYRQAGSFLCPVFNNCLAPFASVFLEKNIKTMVSYTHDKLIANNCKIDIHHIIYHIISWPLAWAGDYSTLDFPFKKAAAPLTFPHSVNLSMQSLLRSHMSNQWQCFNFYRG